MLQLCKCCPIALLAGLIVLYFLKLSAGMVFGVGIDTDSEGKDRTCKVRKIMCDIALCFST